jgi:hypothetical protein
VIFDGPVARHAYFNWRDKKDNKDEDQNGIYFLTVGQKVLETD